MREHPLVKDLDDPSCPESGCWTRMTRDPERDGLVCKSGHFIGDKALRESGKAARANDATQVDGTRIGTSIVGGVNLANTTGCNSVGGSRSGVPDGVIFGGGGAAFAGHAIQEYAQGLGLGHLWAQQLERADQRRRAESTIIGIITDPHFDALNPGQPLVDALEAYRRIKR